MAGFETQLNTQDKAFQQNAASMRTMAQELRKLLTKIQEGGGEKAHERHKQHGKLLPRDRIF